MSSPFRISITIQFSISSLIFHGTGCTTQVFAKFILGRGLKLFFNLGTVSANLLTVGEGRYRSRAAKNDIHALQPIAFGCPQYLSQSHWSLITKRGKRDLDDLLRLEIDEMQLAEHRSSDLHMSFVKFMSLSGLSPEESIKSQHIF